MAWTAIGVQSFSPAVSTAVNGYIPVGGGMNIQFGTKSSVPADGSATAPGTQVFFSQAFLNACYNVQCTVFNPYQSNAWATTVQITNVTNGSFYVNVAGAPAGQLCSVHWVAIGN